LRALSDYDWIVFTSANAVDAFSRRSGARSLPKVAVVGTETSRRAKARGIRVDLVPRTFRAEGLLDALPRDLNGQRILLPRGDLAGKELPEALRSRGAEVDPVVVYRTVLPSGGGDRLRTALGSGRIDCVTLTSGSTVRNLVAMLGEGDSSICLDRTSIAVIGPVTRQVVESFGFEVAIEPQEATMPALARAIREHFSG
jgi:uroporphyrinogen-III synthase